MRRELERLLGTRTSVPAPALEGRERTVIDYGIPDFSTFYARNPRDWDRLGRMLSRAIEAYEPRLQQVKVKVEEYLEESQRLLARIDAVLVVDTISEPVSFPTTIQGDKGVEVRATP